MVMGNRAIHEASHLYKRQREYMRFKNELKLLDYVLTDQFIAEETPEELEIEEIERDIQNAIDAEALLNNEINQMELEDKLDAEEILQLQKDIERYAFLCSEIADQDPIQDSEDKIIYSKFKITSLTKYLGVLVCKEPVCRELLWSGLVSFFK